MVNEKRKLDRFFNISLSLYSFLVLGNIVEVLRELKWNIIKVEGIDSTVTCMIVIIPAAVLIVIMFKYSRYTCNEVVERKAKQLSKKYLLFMFIQVGIGIIVIFLKCKSQFICSQIFMIFFLGAMYFFKFRGDIELLNDRWYIFKRAIESKKGNVKNSSSFWRFKIWFNPKVKLQDRDVKLENYRLMLTANCGKRIWLMIFLAIFIGWINSAFIIIIITILMPIIERKLELYTEIYGIITGIEKGKYERFNGEYIEYYNVYVTDFINEREIKVRVRTIDALENAQELRIYHGAITKTVLKVDGIPIKLLIN